MKKTRILLCDDHAVVRQGFKMILSAQADMEIVGEAANGRSRLTRRGTRPDVVVMDVACGAQRHRGHTPAVSANPHAKVIALSMHRTRLRPRILRAGRGYLLKDSGAGDLVTAIRAVAGENYLSRRLNAVDDYRKHVTNPIDLLSSRERSSACSPRKTNKEIAVVLNLSVYTVDAHRGRIMEKLNLHSINELVRFAVRNGLVD